jgi:ornithine cyclodeaminase
MTATVAPAPLLLTEAEIRELVTPALALDAVREAFVRYARGEAIVPAVVHMDVENGRGEIHVKGAYVQGASTWCVKAASAFSDNPQRGLPAATGVSLALSATTGFLSAVLLDNGYLTDLRTGAAGALAADLLAPDGLQRVLIVGAGAQARYQLEALLGVRWPREVTVFARSARQAQEYAREMSGAHDLLVTVSDSLAEAVQAADVVITTTPSRSPLICAEWLRPGVHITAMGSDLPGKQELESAVLARADVVVADDVAQAATQGELQHALGDGAITRESVMALGDLAAGARGRRDPHDITVADLTGVGVQDAAVADLVVQRALESGAGTPAGPVLSRLRAP